MEGGVGGGSGVLGGAGEEGFGADGGGEGDDLEGGLGAEGEEFFGYAGGGDAAWRARSVVCFEGRLQGI